MTDYKLLSSERHACGQVRSDPIELAKVVSKHLAAGYKLVGTPYVAGGFQYQAVQK